MAVNTQKLVRVLAGPTGPTGTFEGVHILSTFTGPTGTFPVWGQINAAQQAQSPTGTFKSVYPISGTGPAGRIKTVIIPGYAGSPLSLPAGASTLYSTQLVAGWTGPCCRVFRSSDSTQLDIGFVNNQMDVASAVAFAGSSPVIVAKWYDQSGNGNDASNGTLTIAANPIIRSASTGIVFDGDKVLGARQPLLTIPNTLSLSRVSMSLFMAVRPSSSLGQNAAAFTPIGGVPMFELSTSQVSGTRLSMQADATNGLVGFYGGSTVLGTGSQPLPGVPTVVGIVSNGTNTVIYNDGKTTTDAAMTAATMLGGEIGQITPTGFYSRFDLYSMAIYPRALSGAEVAQVKAAFGGAFNTDAAYSKLLVFDGDSITEASQAAELQTIERQAQASLASNVKIYNTGMGGAKWADAGSKYTTFIKPLFNAGNAKNIIVVAYGINDFIANQTAAQVETSVQSYVSTARADGFKVLVSTTLPSTTAHLSAAQDTQRQAYNTWLRANFNSFADGLIDYDNDPTMGTAAGNTGNTALFLDGLHPSASGYTSLVNNELLPALNAIL